MFKLSLLYKSYYDNQTERNDHRVLSNVQIISSWTTKAVTGLDRESAHPLQLRLTASSTGHLCNGDSFSRFQETSCTAVSLSGIKLQWVG